MDQHNRHSIRLSGYAYTQPGAYFVTVCTHASISLFGEITGDTMCLNEYGEIVRACWQVIPSHFPFSKLDVFVIMPNHIHAILWIVDRGQYHGGGDDPGRGDALPSGFDLPGIRGNASPLPQPAVPKGTTPNSLGAMIQNFKSVSTRKINQARQMPTTPLWQRDYYDRIIWSEEALRRIREYIISNPMSWVLDEENPLHMKTR